MSLTSYRAAPSRVTDGPFLARTAAYNSDKKIRKDGRPLRITHPKVNFHMKKGYLLNSISFADPAATYSPTS